MQKLLKWMGATAVFAAGCSLKLPDDYPAGRYTKFELKKDATKEVKDAAGNVRKVPDTDPFELSAEDDRKLGELLDEKLYPPPWTWDENSMAAAHHRVRSGQELYQRHCIHCHGVAGDGKGPTSQFLFPRPRDYRLGVFKWKSTEYSAKPTRDDLLSFLKNGAVGTSMPAFNLLPQSELEDLVDYVIFLSKRGEVERTLLVNAIQEDGKLPGDDVIEEVRSKVEGSWSQADGKVILPAESMPAFAAESDEFEASIKRGKALFLGAGTCVKCHLADGKADPNKMPAEEREKRDDWGFINYPRNLTLGLFRGGRRPVDLYRRVHQGIRGSQMSGLGTQLKPKDIWDVVNFVRVLPYRKGLLTGEMAAAGAPPAAPPAPSAATSGHGN